MSFWKRVFSKQKRSVPGWTQEARHLSYQCAAVQGIGARDYQEDAWKLVNADDVTAAKRQGLLAMVADGMGGMQGGALASATGIQTMAADFSCMDRTMPIAPQLKDSLLRASKEVYRRLDGYGGSTMIACMLYEEQLFYAGLGDSYLYLLRDHALVRINREQTVLQGHRMTRVRCGEMDVRAFGGVSQPEAVTGFLGLQNTEDVDWLRRGLPLKNGDVLLLCSDGVGGVLSENEIRACMRCSSAGDAAAALKQGVLGKSLAHQDNFTAIVIQCIK